MRNRASWKRGFLWSTIFLAGLWILSFGLAAIALKLPDWGASLANSPVPALVGIGQKMMEGGQLFSNIQGLDGEPLSTAITEALVRRLLAPGAWITIWFLLGLTLTYILPAMFKAEKTEEAKSTNHSQLIVPEKQENGFIFVVLLAFAGTLIVIVPEFIYLRDQFGWRMNTIFKFYYQVWLLWSIAAGFGVLYIWNQLTGSVRWVVRGISVVTIAIGLLYPILGLYYTTQGFSPDKSAIGWE